MTTPDYLKGHRDAPFQDADTADEHMANAIFLLDKSARSARIAAWTLGITGFGIILAATVQLVL